MANVKQIKSNDAYQLKISLDHIAQAIWRRIIVDADMKLPDLHKVIQTVMGWYNSHLHQFRIDDAYYALPDEEDLSESTDYRKVRLNAVITKENQKFHYDYDFGDGWEHTIVLEKILPKDKNMQYPICVDGKRKCPPEDCGGPGGYEDLLETIKHPGTEEYEDMMDWLGGEFDPEEFNIDEVNDSLKQEDFGCVILFD
ncbi:MAG: plasmid pRiA4b ORF-3 family protein [Spirochaetes bacterium]|nr:plasmid pRiA4b ORF-3 family protein [Spirochaetota bacterium]